MKIPKFLKVERQYALEGIAWALFFAIVPVFYHLSEVDPNVAIKIWPAVKMFFLYWASFFVIFILVKVVRQLMSESYGKLIP